VVRFTRAARLFWALDSTPVEGSKHFAVGIKPQNEMHGCIGYPSAEHWHHKDDAVADHSHVRPHAGPVVDRVLRVAHAVGQAARSSPGGLCESRTIAAHSGVDVLSKEDICGSGERFRSISIAQHRPYRNSRSR
jgi:hypothetical protein